MKFVVFCIVFLIAAIGFIFLRPQSPELIYSQQIIIQKPISNRLVRDLIIQVNKQNDAVKTFSCDDIKIKVKKIPFKLKACLYYEKPQNFRMVVKSLVGKELDIGSNSQQFWFWSKRMNPPALHYADYKDLNKTCLKTPLNPLWLIESLGMGKINPDAPMSKSGKYIIVTDARQSMLNSWIVKKTLIDTELKAIAGHYLYEADGTLIASAETTFLNSQPKNVRVIWHEENITMDWDLGPIKKNQSIDQIYWQMPSYKNKINLAIETSYSAFD